MLDALRFVAAAVAKKDFVPELTHFKIAGGRVTGYNGNLALSSDIDVDLDVLPRATTLLAAIRACPGTIALSVTAAGRLAVRSGAFRSFVECLPEQAMDFALPEGEAVALGENFLPGLRTLAPLMGVDASRPWSMGIKLQRSSMFATNNVMLAEYWHGDEFPFDIVIPAFAVNELLRIDEPPTRVQMTESSITFWFGGKRWMRSALLDGGMWPIERMSELLSREDGQQLELSKELGEQVAKLKPFLNEAGSVYVTASDISTAACDGEGTSIDLAMPGVTEMQCYNHRQLVLLAEVAKTIDWTAYPRPCMFRGDRLRGAIVGQLI